MKIALVTHDVVDTDGQGKVNLELVRTLSEAGHEIHLYAHRADDRVWRFAGVRVHHVPVWIQKPNLVKSLIFLAAATLMVRRRQFDIIHLNGAVAFLPHDVNTVHLLHNGWLATGFAERPGIRGFYHRLYRLVHARLEAAVLRRARRVVGVSAKVAEEVRNLIPIPAERVTQIFNGCNPSPTPASREALWPGLSETDRLIGFAGDLTSSVKGLETLLKAMVGLEVHLVVSGKTDGSHYPDLARQLGLGERVRFLGFRRDLPSLFGCLDAFVYPTRYDSFGLVVTEAAAAGCPLIISGPRHCGAADLFVGGVSAIFLRNPTDEHELHAQLRRLDPASLRPIGSRGQDAVSRWTWGQMGAAYERLYREVVTERGSAPLCDYSS